MTSATKIKQRLITSPDTPALYVPASRVESDHDWERVNKWAPLMKEYVQAKRTNALSLSATQLGIPLAFFVTSTPDMPTLLFVNPTVGTSGELATVTDACLSCTDVAYRRERFLHVDVRAQNHKGDWFKVSTRHGILAKRYAKAAKLFAQMCQHEMEHLQGLDTRTGEPYDKYLW
jgi:peptide deformylase